MNSKKAFLYTGNTPWVRKGQDNFDIGMGAWDGDESCDIVSLYILDQLRDKIHAFDNGIYRDDALGVVENNSKKCREYKAGNY